MERKQLEITRHATPEARVVSCEDFTWLIWLTCLLLLVTVDLFSNPPR